MSTGILYTKDTYYIMKADLAPARAARGTAWRGARTRAIIRALKRNVKNVKKITTIQLEANIT